MTHQDKPETASDPCSSTLHIWREDQVIWIQGRVYDNRPHKHQALQLVWSAPDTFAELHTEDANHRARALLIDGGVQHALHLEQGTIALVDSASSVANVLRTQFLGRDDGVGVSTMQCPESFEDPQAWLSSLSGAQHVIDPRVREVLAWLDSREEHTRWDEVSLDEALKLAHLSRSRFLHLFSAEVGSPWRTYLIWRRALVAMTFATRGMNLTEVAHASGYSDSAHLSRQFVALFGIVPSALVEHSHFIQS